MADDLIAIVVAGGGSRRLGRLAGAGGKGMIEIAGEAMLSRVCRTLATVVPRVIVVARAGQPLPPLVDAAEVIHDSQPGAGPLAAIRDGLVYAGAGPGRPPRLALLASCDLPRLSTGVVRLLLDLAAPPGILAAAAKARWTVPLVAGHPQVLLSVMAVDLVPLVQAALAAGEAGPRALLERLVRQDPEAVRWVMPAELTAVDTGLESFADIDTADDLRRRSPTGKAGKGG